MPLPSGGLLTRDARYCSSAGTSKKNASSTSPATKLTPGAGSVVITGVGGVAEEELDPVVGATIVSPNGKIIVAICDPPAARRGEKEMFIASSGLASPVVSMSKRYR